MDPCDPEDAKVLLEQARRVARGFRFDEEDARDVVQALTARWLEMGRPEYVKAQFFVAIGNRFLDLRDRRLRLRPVPTDDEVATRVASKDPWVRMAGRLLAVALTTPAVAESDVVQDQEVSRRWEANRKAVAELAERRPDHHAALLARWREALVDAEGEDIVPAVERFLGFSLGPSNGTAELARRRGIAPGTVASHATRGAVWVAARVQELLS